MLEKEEDDEKEGRAIVCHRVGREGRVVECQAGREGGLSDEAGGS